MPASKAQQAVTAQRRKQLIALKLAGMDFEAIADRLDYADDGAARKDFWRAIQRNRLEEKEAVENLREVEGARFERLLAAVWPKALKGDLKAVEAARRLIAERIRLYGVAEPIRAEVSGPGGGAVPISQASIAELRSLIGAAGDPDPEDDEAPDEGDEGALDDHSDDT
jgi:hypothetical protein